MALVLLGASRAVLGCAASPGTQSCAGMCSQARLEPQDTELWWQAVPMHGPVASTAPVWLRASASCCQKGPGSSWRAFPPHCPRFCPSQEWFICSLVQVAASLSLIFCIRARHRCNRDRSGVYYYLESPSSRLKSLFLSLINSREAAFPCQQPAGSSCPNSL